MNCQKFRDNIIDILEGEVEISEKLDIEEHINNCTTCKAHYNKLATIREGMFKVVENNEFKYSSRKSQIMESIDLDKYSEDYLRSSDKVKRYKLRKTIIALAAASVIAFILVMPTLRKIYPSNSTYSRESSKLHSDYNKMATDNSQNIKEKVQPVELVSEDKNMTEESLLSPSEADSRLSAKASINTNLIRADKEGVLLYNGDLFYLSMDGKPLFYLKGDNFNMSYGSSEIQSMVSSTERFILLYNTNNHMWYIVDKIKEELLKINIDTKGTKIKAVWSSNDKYVCLMISKDIYLYNTSSGKTSYVGNEGNYTVSYVTDEGIMITADNKLLPSGRAIEGIKPYKLFAYNSYIYALCYDKGKNTELYRYNYSDDNLLRVTSLGKRQFTYDRDADNPFLITTDNYNGIIFNLNTLKAYNYYNKIEITGDFKSCISPDGDAYINESNQNSNGMQTIRIYSANIQKPITIQNVARGGIFIDNNNIVYSVNENSGSGYRTKIIKEKIGSGDKNIVFSSGNN